MQVGDYKALFISEAGDILQALETGVMALENGEDRQAAVEELFRHAHNLKGMSGAMGYDHVVEASHALENLLDRCRRGELIIAQAEADLLLRVVDLLGELVRRTVSDDPGDVMELLGDILVMLAPMAMRGDVLPVSDERTGGTAQTEPAPEVPVVTAAELSKKPSGEWTVFAAAVISGFQTFHTFPAKSGPGFNVGLPGCHPEGVTSPVARTC